jgi:hypothetical protein
MARNDVTNEGIKNTDVKVCSYVRLAKLTANGTVLRWCANPALYDVGVSKFARHQQTATYY